MEIGSWTFNNKLCEDFDNHVSKSVPGYELFHNYIVNLSQFFLEDDSFALDIGCSTGTLIAKMTNANPGKYCEFTGVDNSINMCEQAEELLGGLDNVYIWRRNILDWFNRKHDFKFSFITSMLTLQFIPYEERQEVLKNCYENLTSSGAMVVVEKIIQEDGYNQKMFDEIYQQMKHENGLDKEHLFDKTMSLRGKMTPLTSKDNEAMFRMAGFSRITPFIQFGCFKGWILRKYKGIERSRI